MTPHAKLNVSNLDFDTIKNNLKAFLSSQDEFSEYNFAGSSLDVLLDVLSYNTHYNAFYVNMLANEMFLDTAILRKNVVAKAKALGYTPRSVLGSKAIVTVQITPDILDLPPSLMIDKNTSFKTVINGQVYVFNTSHATNVVKDINNDYISTDIELKQGVFLSHSYTANTSDPSQKFLLPNADTDTTTLVVKIKPSASISNVYVYSKAVDLATVNSTSNVYFLHESSDGMFEVSFGDGVVGRSIIDGNVVMLDGLVSDGDKTNGSSNFTPTGSVGGYSNVSVTTTTPAFAGSSRETVESIKFNAPKLYETQNRAVTNNDYKRIIVAEYTDADSITTWGGEDNDPPVYGKIFIAIKPKAGTVLTTSAKNYVNQILASKKIVSITPEVVEPAYLYMKINITLKYNPLTSEVTAAALGVRAKTAVIDYGINNLSKFDMRFRFSKLSTILDNVDQSVYNSLTNVKLYKKIPINVGVSSNYNVKFSNEIFHPNATYIGAIKSTAFVYRDVLGAAHTDCFIDDDDGVLHVTKTIAGDRTIVFSDIGSIDYGTGTISLNAFNPVSITGTTLDITIIPASSDIAPVRDQIILIESDDVVVNVQQDTTESVGVVVTGTTTSTTGDGSGGTAGSGGVSS